MPDPVALPADPVWIGDFLLHPDRHELSRDGERQRLPRRLVELLLALAERPGETLGRQQLVDRVWRRPAVTDEVLSRSMAQLRQLLGDDPRAPRYIETIPKRGYRLIAAVRLATADAAAPAADLGAAASAAADPSPSPPDPALRARPPGRALAAGLGLLALLALLAAGLWWPSASTEPWTATALTRERPFISDDAFALQPRYSPDGRWLAYIEWLRDGGGSRLVLASADGQQRQILDAGEGRLRGPAFSPDSATLALLARVGERCEVRTLRLPGGRPLVAGACNVRDGDALEWVSDDSVVLTAAPEPGRASGLVRLHLPSGELSPLTAPPLAAVSDGSPRRSADGRLAFLRGPPLQRRLMLLDDNGERVLLDAHGRMPGIAWTPDGAGLIVASDSAGYPALLWVDASSGAQRLLGGRGAATLDVGPDGTLLYEQRRYQANLWRFDRGGQARRLTDSSRYDAQPALSPDGRQLAYLSNRQGVGSVWLLDLASGAETPLALPPARFWTRPAWTADGAGLLLTRYADDGESTRGERLELTSGRLHAVEADAFGLLAAADGSHVFGRAEAGAYQLFRRRPGQPAEALAGFERASEFRVAGDWLAAQIRGEAGIRLAPLDGGAAVTLLPDLAADAEIPWSLAADALYAGGRDDVGPLLWRVSLPDGSRELLRRLEHPAVGPGLAVGTDGAVIVSLQMRLDSDLLEVPPAP